MQTAIPSSLDLSLRTAERVVLFSARGAVHTIREFTREHLVEVGPHERLVILNRIEALPDRSPVGLVPLTRAERLHDGTCTTIGSRRGARSAFVAGLGLKLKGCRPENTTFPSWQVDDDHRIRIVQIPFGTLRSTDVVREVLGYCFLLEHGVAPMSVPVAVIEYHDVAGDARFALVSTAVSDARVEGRIDCGGTTLHGLLRRHRSKRVSQDVGREVSLTGIDRARYIDRKSDLLMKLNGAGGFRGILNSNIGNDVIAGQELAGLCDFDTFTVRPLPATRDIFGIRRYVFQAMLELVKTSLPFVDFIDLSQSTTEEGRDELSRYYQANSSLYRAYREKFLRFTTGRKWNARVVSRQIDAALHTPAAGELLKELIPNSLTFSEFTAESWYVSHG